MQEQWQTDQFTYEQILNCNLHTDSTDLFKIISSKESFIHKSDASIASHIEYICSKQQRFLDSNSNFLLNAMILKKSLKIRVGGKEISETTIHGVPQGCCYKIKCRHLDQLREGNCIRQPAENA